MSDNNQGGLSIRACIMIAVGGMVGSSIFTLSGVTYGMAGPSAILSWILAGLVLFIYALNLAELSTTFPRMGGIFVYPNILVGKTQAQRDLVGWLSGWSWLNVSILGVSFSAISVSTYLQEFFPAIQNSPFLQLLIPVLWIGFGWFINSLGLSTMGKINSILITTLGIILFTYIGMGIGHAEPSNFSPFISGSMGATGMISSVPIAMLGYGSILAIASIGGEIEDAKNSIPKIMIISVLITITVYAAIVASTVAMAPVDDFLSDPSRQYYPLAYALMNGLNGKWGGLLAMIPLGALLAISNSMLILVMDAGRTAFAVAEAGFLPKRLTQLSGEKQTPVAALTFVSVISALITLKPDLIWAMINTGSICSAIVGLIIAFTVITLRKKQAKGEHLVEGAFKVPGGIALPVLSIVTIGFVLIVFYFGDDGPTSYMMAGIWYLIGFVIFGIRQFVQKKNAN